MNLGELEISEQNYYIMEDDRLRRLSTAKTDEEKKFLRSQLCEIRGRQSDLRDKRLQLKFKG